MKVKNKISRIVGVVLTLALLSSLILVAVPVSAGTQTWSTVTTPSATGLVLDNGNTWTGPFAIDINGSAIYAGSNVGGTTPGLVKSIDGGRTWSVLTGFPGVGVSGAITDIVASSMDDQIVYVTDGDDIWRTIDGGTTWTTRGNLFTSLGLIYGTDGYITSIDVAYDGVIPYIYAGTSAFGVVVNTGGVYGKQDTIFAPWTNLNIGTNRPTAFNSFPNTRADVTEVVVDPVNFATTQLVMAVVTDRLANLTYVTSKFGGAVWNAAGTDVTLPGVVDALYGASIWLPDDFNATTNMMAFVGVDSMTDGEGDVYIAQFGTSPATDLDISGTGTGTIISSLDGVGPSGTAQLLAAGSTEGANNDVPRVFRSSTGGFTWTIDTKAPVGGASVVVGTRAFPSVLVLDATTALVGTHGPAAGAENGVSITNDSGRTWNGISLLNGTIASIDDLELGSLFMTTTGGVATSDAVWRQDGTNWERVFLGTAQGSNYIVEASPAGDAIFVADFGSTAIMRSTDDGQTWGLTVPIAAPGPISGMVVANANQYAVSFGTGVSTTTTNGGWWNTAVVAGVGTIQSLAYDQGTGDLLVGGINGGVATVARSQDFGVSWTVIASATNVIPVPFTPNAGNAVIAIFSYDYGNDSTIYATGTEVAGDTSAGVWSYNFSWATANLAWVRIDVDNPLTGTDADTVLIGTGLVSAPGGPSGMVYAADGTAAAGASRIRYFPPTPTTNINIAEQMANTGAHMGLWYESGSNILYSLVGNTIQTYTDTLNVNGTGVAVSAVAGTAATISWDELANAATYAVFVSTTAQQTDFYTAANVPVAITVVVNNAARTAAITVLTANTTYFVSVWALSATAGGPVSSFRFSGTTSFLTLPAAPGAVVANLMPPNGAVNVPVSGPAFAWAAVVGAVSYDFQLSRSPTFVSLLTPGTVNVTVPYLVWAGTLENETAYYWQVRTRTIAGVSAWVTQVFTTVIAFPDLEIPPQLTPTITIEIPDIVLPEIPDLADLIGNLIPDITLEPIVIPPLVLPDITLEPIVIPPLVLPDIIMPDIILPAPQVTVVPPVVTVTTVPAPVVTVEQIAPAYIWAIVIIGGVLVIAVIILIVRTRRIV